MIENIFDNVLVVFLRNQGGIGSERYPISSINWDLLIRQARRANLLSRVAFFLQESEQLINVPLKPRIHLESALAVGEANARSVKWEIKQIYLVLQKAQLPFMLLKGAAYAHRMRTSAKGRVFSDVDIMLAAEQIDAAEKVFVHSGWIPASFDSYDQQYYRKWMHEIPPLRHLKRQTNLDVHHTIIPPTSRLKPDVHKFWASAEKIDGIYVLSLNDMILHSATHLFHEGEFEGGLRDISDLSLLLDEFSQTGKSWSELKARAYEQNLGGPLYYAIHYCELILHTVIPESFVNMLERENSSYLKTKIMDFLFMRALMPDHPSCDDRWTGLARWLLYIRSHWLRMPMSLLIPHLLRKSWLRLTGKTAH
ncbi:MAG: hypothetical protein GQ532_06520 [Methylomarinum sp.]|nr:hypothetical protein [Methylomarinum sp.]